MPEAKATGSVKNMFGLERLIETLNANPDASPEQTLEAVNEAVAAFVQDAEQFDDLTMLAFEYRGALS